MRTAWNKGRPHPPETRKKISVAVQKGLADGKMRYWQGKKLSKEHRKKLSEKATGRIIPPEVRKKMSINSSKPFLGKTHPKKARVAHSKKMREQFTNGRVPWNKGIPRTKEERKKMSRSAKLLWKDENHVQKIIKARHTKPSGLEKQVIGLLDKQFPDEWKYVGDLSFMVDGKNPDFMNVNGQKKLIEVFGDYWHEKYEEPERIAHFAKFGFETLVIWEHELKDGSGEQKIIEFCSEGVQG